MFDKLKNKKGQIQHLPLVIALGLVCIVLVAVLIFTVGIPILKSGITASSLTGNDNTTAQSTVTLVIVFALVIVLALMIAVLFMAFRGSR